MITCFHFSDQFTNSGALLVILTWNFVGIWATFLIWTKIPRKIVRKMFQRIRKIGWELLFSYLLKLSGWFFEAHSSEIHGITTSNSPNLDDWNYLTHGIKFLSLNIILGDTTDYGPEQNSRRHRSLFVPEPTPGGFCWWKKKQTTGTARFKYGLKIWDKLWQIVKIQYIYIYI